LSSSAIEGEENKKTELRAIHKVLEIKFKLVI
jgi:hypothetical protein